MESSLYYGDNLEVLRRSIRDESVDLCYIDPPFNSRRGYQRIYHNHLGGEDPAPKAHAFTDTWVWDEAARDGLQQILENRGGLYTPPVIELITGLRQVLKEGSLLAYLVSMTLRIAEIHRVLKQTGSFYLHCDPAASHYLKLLLDALFVAQGGEFQNEIIWCYTIGGKARTRFAEKHDCILFYTKSNKSIHTFNAQGASIARRGNSHMKARIDADGRQYQEKTDRKTGRVYRYHLDEGKIAEDYWTDIETLNREDKERLGYPTQKPEALLERIIRTSSNAGDLVLDAYCGCGTTAAVAQRLNRRWIGIDNTYQAISLVLKRLEDSFGRDVLKTIALKGIPSDMDAATTLANKRDDRLRNEFEKWAVLTYTNNHAILSDSKSAAQGIDGAAYFLTNGQAHARIIFQVKSDHLKSADVATLRDRLEREQATLAVLITLEKPTPAMILDARAAGRYQQGPPGKSYDRIQLVTIQEILEQHKRLNIQTRA
jgi:site-specific DNA-methyltransferase (adenine-specific)